MKDIDTSNIFLVSAFAGGNLPDGCKIKVMRDFSVLTRDEALNLAAWLVAMADPRGDDFRETLRQIQST